MRKLKGGDSGLFLKAFPEEKERYDIILQRAQSFVDVVKKVDRGELNYSSVESDAAKYIYDLNVLGFMTSDAQTGICNDFTPEHIQKSFYGTRELAEETDKKYGVGGHDIVNCIYVERAYVEGFIRKELITKLYSYLPDYISIVLFPNVGKFTYDLTKLVITMDDGFSYEKFYTKTPENSLEDVEEYFKSSFSNAYNPMPAGVTMKYDPKHWELVEFTDLNYCRNGTSKNGLFVVLRNAMINALKEI